MNTDTNNPSRAVRAFVWDLADEGIDEVLGRLHDSGVTGLNLALACHGGRFYCAHNPKHGIIHAPDGALYFQPLLSCYEGIRPFTHPQYGSGAFVARVREAVRDYGMSFTASLTLFNNRTLSIKYPDCMIVNALGDRLEGALCPANTAVRTYAQALVEDLAHRLEVDAIEIENFAFSSHEDFMGPCWRGVPIGQNLGYLLSLCFCEHCRRRAEEANIEVDDLIHHVGRMITSGMMGDLSDRRIGDEISDPYHPLGRYGAMRGETITTLLDDLSDAIEGSSAVLCPVLTEEPDESWRWGIELAALRRCQLHPTIGTSHTTAAIPAFVERYAEILQLGRNIAVDLNLNGFRNEEESSLFATVEACSQAGIDRFIFSHYGLVPLYMMEWIGGLAHH